jgi:hypothetical protein
MKVPMEIKIALVADAANLSQEGKLNILGAFTDIRTSEVPARHPEMQLVLLMEASAAESGRTKKLEVKLLDEDGIQVGGMAGEFVVANPPRPGQRIQMSSILRFTDVVFPKEGAYSLHIMVDGDTKAEVPMSVSVTSDGAEGNAN